MSDPEVDVCDACIVDDVSRESADGGLAAVDLAAAGRAASDAGAVDLTGEKCDCAELGRSGTCRAAAMAAFRWATIASRTDWRPAGSPDFALEAVGATLGTKEAVEPAFGFLLSFSSCPLDLASRLFIILNSILVYVHT
jgi:hypothetical protein